MIIRSENRRIEERPIRRAKDIQNRQQILSFLQEAVDNWLERSENEGKFFSASTFVGGERAHNWSDIPPGTLFDRHIRLGKSPEDSHTEAGKDIGYFLREVLMNDERTFESRPGGKSRKYRII